MRKLKLTPMQGKLLLMLEEAGEETRACILATLAVADDAQFDREIDALKRIGLVFDSCDGIGRPTLVLTSLGRKTVFC